MMEASRADIIHRMGIGKLIIINYTCLHIPSTPKRTYDKPDHSIKEVVKKIDEKWFPNPKPFPRSFPFREGDNIIKQKKTRDMKNHMKRVATYAGHVG